MIKTALVFAGVLLLFGCAHSFQPGAGAYKPGDKVPAVNPADLKAGYAMWVVRQGGASVQEYQQACKAGVDISAVMDRLGVISLLELRYKEQLPRLKNGRVTDAVIQDAATIPLDGMGIGIVRVGAPFDVDEFFRQISSH